MLAYFFQLLLFVLVSVMKTSKKSRAEIQRQYRQRLLERDAEAVREKERKRWHIRRTQKKVKTIDDIPERSKRIVRRRWRAQKSAYRANLKAAKARTPPSPPSSSDEPGFVERKKRGRARMAYNRTKAYRRIVGLTASLQSEKSSKEKYRKRWLRLKMSVNSSTASTSTHNVSNVSDVIHDKSQSAEQETTHHGNKLDVETQQLIADFFTRDDNSRLTTGKKQTVTKNKVKEQKRLLLDTVSNLHEKFCAEYPTSNISYVTLTRYRPFWVRQPTAKDRETCLCKKHENVQLAVDKLHQLGALSVKNVEELLKGICCSVNRKECMFRECEACLDKRVQFQDKCLLKDESIVVWSEWETVSQIYEKDGQEKCTKVTRKSVKRGTLRQLKDKACESVRNELARHVYIIRHQFREYKHLKETVDVNEAIVHIDFSENYICKNVAEIQSAHFGASNHQATLHTGVIYHIGGHFSFTSISDCLRHDAAAVWAHLKPVLLELKTEHPEITDIHFFSDGPTTQYRNKVNFYLLTTFLQQLGFLCGTWNFFESGHGKGAPDAIGGAVKRQADKLVLSGVDLPDAKILYDRMSCGQSVTKFHFIDEDDIACMDSLYPKSVKCITGTMKLHQLLTYDNLELAYRNLSCYCQRPTVCSCYNLRRSKFPPLKHNTVSTVSVQQSVLLFPM